MYKAQNNIKHKIIGERAFTKDGFLVYNLRVDNIPQRATVPVVYEYFKKFGKVLNVDLNGRGKKRKCFVYIAEPEVAAKILKEKCHFLMNSLIRVGASCSLHQPDGQELVKSIDEMYSKTENAYNSDVCSNNGAQDALILTLNDDCLEYICKKLSHTDQISFGVTCRRFHDVMVMLFKAQYATLNTDIFRSWPLLKVRLFLQIVGPQVKSLVHIYNHFNTVVNYLRSFCLNVEKLTVYCKDSSSRGILLQNMKLLRELELHGEEFKYIYDKYVNNLGCLEKLSLIDCDVAPWQVERICKNLKNLQYLDIRCCQNLNTEEYVHISEHLLQLKTLKLSCTKGNFNYLAQLPNLTSLELCKNLVPNAANEEFLANLAKSRANQLEELKLIDVNLKITSSIAEFRKLKVLHCDYIDVHDNTVTIFSQLNQLEDLQLTNCNSITDEHVLQLLKNCLKLKHIDLHRSLALTADFLNNALKLLQEQRDNLLRKGHVHIEINPYECICKNFVRNSVSDVLEVTCVPVTGRNIDAYELYDYVDDGLYDDLLLYGYDNLLYGDDSDFSPDDIDYFLEDAFDDID